MQAKNSYTHLALKPLTLAIAFALAANSHVVRAADDASLSEITVTGVQIKQAGELDTRRINSGDTASLLDDAPGVSAYTNGGASSLPVIHGMNDDRVKVLVDGMSITSACANHMNPATSYISATNVAKTSVIAGLAPVSMGGDSIAGTISLASAPPVFAGNGEGIHKEGSLAASFRSINSGSTLSASAAVASSSVSLGYTGSVDKASSYKDGNGNLVRDTLYETRNHQLTLGVKGDSSTLVVKAGQQSIPYQGFVNQYMDMVGNDANYLNLNYKGDYAWGKLDARVYTQDTKHAMGFFTPEKPGTMPMNTHGQDLGYDLRAELPLSQQNTLRLGNEYHSAKLDDWWPPVPMSMMMGPNTYQNINNGKRDRFSLFAEVESKLNEQWMSLLGLRTDSVKTDTGMVQSYGCGMMCAPDTAAAAAFNASNRARSDNNIDLTALARYEASQSSTYEFGYSRKTRSPNLYERYSWGVGQMAMDMIGWFGDGNGYLGNPNLKPEVADTLSATAKWDDGANKEWEFAVTPYYTKVKDYIGVNKIGTFANGTSKLQFVNHDAKIYGLDISSKAALWDNSYGIGQVKTVLGWTHGTRTDTGGNLYHIMPFNARVTLEQSVSSWTNAAELQLVGSKSNVDTLRNEPATSGYTLVNLRTAYQLKSVRLDLGVANLFNKFYSLPLGGADIADWKAGGSVGLPGAVAGAGRSINAGFTVKF
jgi:iron complex outermembrane receptor protein